MDADVLFVGIAVRDFETAKDWYESFFGRRADVIAHEEEVMWRVTEAGWLYILRNSDHAGSGMAAVAVSNIETVTTELASRGVKTGPIEPEGNAGLKAVVLDPDGNSIAIIQVAPGE